MKTAVVLVALLASWLVVSSQQSTAQAGLDSAPMPARSPASTRSATFRAIFDGTVDQSAPTTKYGGSNTLSVFGATNGDNAMAAYVQFDVAGIGEAVRGAKLRLYCTTNGTARAPQVYLTSNDWNERITWSNQPGATGRPISLGGQAVAPNGWAEWDVSSAITGNGIYSFVITSSGPDGAIFSSRQGTNPPQLVITPGA